MIPNDRTEFDELLDQLCAGFGVPPTKARREAFWVGLARMSLGSFRGAVAQAITEATEKTSPTVGLIWRVHRELHPIRAAAPVAEAPDHLEYFANRLLWLHVSHRGGLGSGAPFLAAHRAMADRPASAEFERCLAAKSKLVTEFAGYIRASDELATPANFVTFWLAALRNCGTVLPRTAHVLEELAARPNSQIPFAAFMAREL